MTIELREVKKLRDLKKFVLFPFALFKDDKNWVPPMIKGEMDVLRSDRNPAHEHCDIKYLLAYKNGKIVGRIAGIINHLHNEYEGRFLARFSWFDFIDDIEVSRSLLDAIKTWAIEKGMDGIIGPIGFTTFDRQGILVEGFDELPTISSTYNFPYYPEHLERIGYGKESDYLEFEVTVPDDIPERSQHFVDMIAKRYNLRLLRPKSKKELFHYGEEAFRVLNSAYEAIRGFVPLTNEQIKFFLKKYFSVVHPDYTTAVVDEHDKLVGIQIAIPSFAKAFQKARGKLFPFGFMHVLKAIKKPNRIDVLLIGVLPEHQNKGVNTFFINELTKSCIQHNITLIETNGLLEDNLRVQYFKKYAPTRQHKRRRLYFKSLKE